jgi:uncharacterized protein (DUF1786 family)
MPDCQGIDVEKSQEPGVIRHFMAGDLPISDTFEDSGHGA